MALTGAVAWTFSNQGQVASRGTGRGKAFALREGREYETKSYGDIRWEYNKNGDQGEIDRCTIAYPEHT